MTFNLSGVSGENRIIWHRERRRQEHRRSRGYQDQVRCFRRFFENFQQRVRGSVVELISLINQEHSRLAFKRSKVRFLFDLPHLLDTQHTFWRDHEANVRMIGPDDLRPLFRIVTLRIIQLNDARARRACAARLMVLRERQFKARATSSANSFFPIPSSPVNSSAPGSLPVDSIRLSTALTLCFRLADQT